MNSNFDHSRLTFVAIQSALQAGEILKKGFGTQFEILLKPGFQNLVTEYDRTSEQCIIANILKHFPDHAFLAEESGASANRQAPVLWIIDPLDGTVNFAHNIPIFTVSIAAVVEHKIVSGVIYQPITGELFMSEAGRGAYLNGVKLQVSTNKDLTKTLMSTGFPYNVAQNPRKCVDFFASMIKLGYPIRRLGSAALDMAYVAAGRFDVYWEVELNPWDTAAGHLLIEEAGGKVTEYDGSARDIFSKGGVLATNGLFHPEMMTRLTQFSKV
ncbi:MAG TPA: inositol monophosphatase family protein [Rhabdochlamydiaceae bacterium]|nr:inositol monophosphatase family protein [Rhabdochlamydiaceae bacterium]